jgi:hypothetical protein
MYEKPNAGQKKPQLATHWSSLAKALNPRHREAETPHGISISLVCQTLI